MELEPKNVEITFLNNLNLDLTIQVVLLLVLVLYSFFAVLIYKQVKILNQAIQTKRSGLLNSFALAHLAWSLLALAVVILAILL